MINKLRFFIFAVLISNFCFGQDLYTRHLKYGTPSACNLTNQKLIIKTQYISCYDSTLKTSRWVIWNTRFNDYGPSDRYTGSFFQENGFVSATNKDFLNSGYDKGHLVPSEERTSTDVDNYQTFSYINVVPQSPSLNRGPWYDLEKYVRGFVTTSTNNQVFQMAGGVYYSGYSTIGSGIKIPAKTWKVVLFLQSNKVVNTIYVIMPQAGPGVIQSGDTWKQFITTKKIIEGETGLKVY